MKARNRRRPATDVEGGDVQLSLLPEPPFAPTWPEPGTLAARCLEIFLRGASLTHPQFEALTFSWRLAAVVGALRDLGWPIVSHDVSAPTRQTPDRLIARYSLPARFIAQAILLQGGRHA